MSTPWYRRVSEGLTRTRDELSGQINVLLRRGPDLDDGFWDGLEETLIRADMGVPATTVIIEELRDSAARLALPDASAVIDHLSQSVASRLRLTSVDILGEQRMTLVVVGVNGTGKTTTVGKLAGEILASGRSVLIGSGDTYRAAAIEQLDIWAKRAGVPVIARERGSDPAAVAFDAIAAAKADDVDVALIDTAGRLHTARDLMAELEKVLRVVRRESEAPVRVLLVVDATTGQNGLLQAKTFHDSLAIDGLVLTKLDGTAKGGIAVAIVQELGIPILRVGVGEGMDDLKPFDPDDFARALVSGS